jgi:flagellar biosynthetic protein FliR
MIGIGADDLEFWLSAFLYPFFRMLALMSSAPLLSQASVPVPTRLGLAVLLTVLVAPTLPAGATISPFSVVGVLLIFQQVIVGVALGFSMQLAFSAVELAGNMIGLQMGLSFAVFIDPQNSTQSPIVGSFLSMILTLLFLAINGHLMMISAVVDSFRAVPIGIDASHTYHWLQLASAGSQVFVSGLQIAMPIIGAMMLANLTLGVLTRTAPQLNLFAVGFPVTIIVGLLMLLLGMPYLMPELEKVLYLGLSIFTR